MKGSKSKMLLEDWELAHAVATLMWACDDKTCGGRCEALTAAGHEARFVLGMNRADVSKIVAGLIAGDESAKKNLFEVPERVEKNLADRPRELKRRLADAERGMKSRYIASQLIEEKNPAGGQGYLVFRTSPRSNKCIVYMLGW